MKLSRKKAIALCIELWTFLAETEKEKWEWPRWKEIKEKYGDIKGYCFFCELTLDCADCPYYEIYGHCMDSVFKKWLMAETPEARKKYAKLFLEQIKSIEGSKRE